MSVHGCLPRLRREPTDVAGTARAWRGNWPRSGMTLVEVAMAIVVLAVLAIGAGAFLYHARASISIQRNRRIALENANSRLEALQASDFDAIKPVNRDYATNYLQQTVGGWALTLSDPGETVLVNARSYPMVTTVRYVDVDGGAASYDCLHATVSAGYRLGTGDRVRLDTLIAP